MANTQPELLVRRVVLEDLALRCRPPLVETM